MQKLKAYARLIILILILLFTASCGPSITPIADIMEQADEYRDQGVRVEGIIDTIISIPFVKIRAFRLVGDNDSIWVLGQAPATEGSFVIVTGRVDTAISFGDMNLGTVIKLDDGE